MQSEGEADEAGFFWQYVAPLAIVFVAVWLFKSADFSGVKEDVVDVYDRLTSTEERYEMLMACHRDKSCTLSADDLRELKKLRPSR